MARARCIEVWRMQADLSTGLPPPDWPQGLVVTQWNDASAPAVYSLLKDAYSRGGGEVPAGYEEWFGAFTRDPEFDPSACILAFSDRGLAGVALCWSSAFIKDLCVAGDWRNRGLGEALVRAAMALFAGRREPSLQLKVEADNPSGAPRLYQRCGFQVVKRMELGAAPES